jgi:hypothetical protein
MHINGMNLKRYFNNQLLSLFTLYENNKITFTSLIKVIQKETI